MTTGEIIREKRENKGMTQGELAEAVGVTRPMIVQIERGSKTPNMVLGGLIADVLGCTLDELRG